MLLFSKSIKVLSFLAVAGVSLGSVAKAEILFDQMTNYNPSIISSSWYAPDGADGDTYSWDNFLLPNDSIVREVWWNGGGAPITKVTVRFYEGLPAAPDLQPKITALPESETSADYLKGYSFTLAQVHETPVGGGINSYHVTLPTPLKLPGNKVFWIKIEADSIYGSFWGLCTATHGRDQMHFRFITGYIFQRISGSEAFQLRGTKLLPSVIN